MSLRNNLIVYGISEVDNESFVGLKRLVCDDVFQSPLDVTTSPLEHILRLGKQHINNTHLVMVRFFNVNHKIKVFKSAIILKGRKISISGDYSKRLQYVRKCL